MGLNCLFCPTSFVVVLEEIKNEKAAKKLVTINEFYEDGELLFY